jgi:hypothetical protein
MLEQCLRTGVPTVVVGERMEIVGLSDDITELFPSLECFIMCFTREAGVLFFEGRI